MRIREENGLETGRRPGKGDRALLGMTKARRSLKRCEHTAGRDISWFFKRTYVVLRVR